MADKFPFPASLRSREDPGDEVEMIIKKNIGKQGVQEKILEIFENALVDSC